jgi:carboxymethylenebutenolidase
MNAMQRYLAEEVVEDYADGIITRREALRRLGLLGVGVPAATALVAACGSGADPSRPTAPATSSAPATAPAGSRPAGPPPLPTAPITFAGPAGRTLQGAWAAAKSPRGSVLVIHENKGLTDHIRSVAGRLAASGYSALALDLLSEEGGSGRYTDPGQLTAALNAVPPQRFVEDMKAAVTELLRRQPTHKVGTVGFCFGGGMVWSLLAGGESRLAAAAPFYGPLPDKADFAGARPAAVLAVYGALDSRVNATRDAARAALERAGLAHDIVTFPDADHAFFNDTGPRYNPTAAAGAYQRLLDWYGKYLG